ncbi:MAG TPA: hypothetical protein VI688_02975 [Anaerolineales bacterium]|nr:hypothetical protein [Anaerolineales bacterium]
MFEHKQEKERGFRPQANTTRYPVVIQTTHNQIRGNLHVRENERIKDALNSNELFIAITNVQIFNADGTLELRKSEFLAINRSHVIWIIESAPPTGSPKG